MQQVINILHGHGNEIEQPFENGRIYVKDWYRLLGEHDFEWVDITEWTVEDANKWLGY